MIDITAVLIDAQNMIMTTGMIAFYVVDNCSMYRRNPFPVLKLLLRYIFVSVSYISRIKRNSFPTTSLKLLLYIIRTAIAL